MDETRQDAGVGKISVWIRTHLFGLGALFLALTIAPAWGAATIGPTDIKTNAVLSRHIRDGQVKSPDIGTGAVHRADLANGGVNNLKLATGAVGPGKLATGAVSTPKLANGAVNSAKVADNSLTGADIDESTLGTVPNADALDGISSGGFWQLGGNAGTTSADFLGTTDDTALNLRVDNARGLRIEPASDGGGPSPNVVGGSPDNSVDGSAFAATISGGGRSNFAAPQTANDVSDSGGTVGGGGDNQAGDDAGTTSDAEFATVGGGRSNTASGGTATVGGGDGNTASAGNATVGGGSGNTASGNSAAIGGGGANSASGLFATVAGGAANSASGSHGIVPGGTSNSAGGSNSFAAGNRAKANNAGTYVWGDSQNADMASTANNQFIARAAGHFFLQSDSSLDDQGGFLNTSTGAFLSTGGTWTNNSDENLKRDFEPVGPRAVLDKVAALPVRSWEYKTEPGVRHLGPTAQDFYAAFGLGGDDRHIASIDADGVSLAAIKGLARELRAERRRRREQDRRIAHLEVRLAALERKGR